MPRPITQADIKKMRAVGYHFRQYKHSKLGIYIRRVAEPYYAWAYRVDRDGYPKWVTRATLVKRMRRGHPKKPRSKMLMKDIAIFSMEEIEQAYGIMEEMQ